MLAVALHRQLLQIGGEALQVLLVRQHGHGLGAEEVGVPDGQQPHEHRQVALERRGAEVLVHLVEAVEHGAEVLRADGEHRRQADRRVHRVAPADPVPEPEHVGGVDAELRRPCRRSSRRRRSAWPPPSRRRPGPRAASARALWALVIVSSVVKVFDETMNSVSAGSRSRVASTKSVPSTLETKRNVMRAVAVVLERLVGHHRAEVGAADADVDDVADALAGVALPVAAAHAVGEGRHRVEHGVDVGHDVLAVDHDRRAARGAQGDVQHGPVLGDVDLVAAEHGVDALAQAGLLGQLQSRPGSRR